MLRCLFLFLLPIYFHAVATASSSNETSPLDKRKTECFYKSSVYREGETILIDEPCLACTCHSGALVCSLRVCPKFPEPLPQGCVILQKTSQCCPQLMCDEPGTQDSKWRPKAMDDRSCLVNGSMYSEGSALSASSECDYCYCISGQQRCAKPHCSMSLPGCKPVTSSHSCFPTHYECPEDSNIQPQIKGCELDGHVYQEGQQMPSTEPCENCYCINGKPMCAAVSCTVQQLEGCYPVYMYGQCCPTSYNCTKSYTDEKEHFLQSNKLRSIGNGFKSYQNITRYRLETTTANFEETRDTTTDPESTSAEFQTTKMVDDLIESTTDYSTETTDTVSTEEMSTTTDLNTSESPTVTTYLQDTTSFSEENTTYSPPSTTDLTSTTGYYSIPTTLPTELNIITAPDNFYSVNLSSDVRFQGRNGSQNSREVQERVQTLPDGGLSENETRTDDEYASYDYEEPQLPPSLPNLVIYPFVAADAVTKEEGPKIGERSETEDEVGPVYYKNYFSPPKETEGGFVPKDEASEGESNYQGTLFIPDGTDHSQDNEHFIPPITLPSIEPSVLEFTTMTHEKQPNFPTFPPVTIADTIDVTPDPFRDVIRTEPAPDLPSLMSDILPYLRDQQTKKPVSVNYKNVVVDYYPSHYITTRRNDERKTTMVIEKSPTYQSSTESMNISDIELTSASPVFHPEQLYITTEDGELTSADPILEASTTPSLVTTTLESSRIRTPMNHGVLKPTEPPRRVDLESQIKVESSLASEKVSNIVGVRPKPIKKPFKQSTPVTSTTTTESDSFLNEFLKGFFEAENDKPSTMASPNKQHPKYGHKYSSKIRNPPFMTSTVPSIEVIENRGGEEENTGSFSLDSVLHMLFSAEEGDVSNSTTVKPMKVKNGTKYTRKPAIRKTKKPVPVTVPVRTVTKSPDLSTTIHEKTQNSTLDATTPTSRTTMSYPTTLATDTSESDLLKTTSKGESSFVTDENTGFPIINILKQDVQKPNKLPQPENTVQQESLRKPSKLSGGLGTILKLAGCNIYGRMYRVGKVIAELSNPCLECMCTDSGVQCSQLLC